MNRINIIYPYRYHNWWVFDDYSRDLDKEPFVAGAETLLDILVGEKATECCIIFSKDEFSGSEFSVKLRYKWLGGGNYLFKKDGYKHKLWLCPALLKYFDKIPKNIYFQFQKVNSKS